ncbi:MAG TPA: hypothetical protein VHI78_09640, partial [Bacteroidales bacterium]|nr:hypothetical protein [Bacteroidales bacterium]
MPYHSGMTPTDYYYKRIREYREKGDKFNKLETHLSMARLITFLSGITLFFVFLSVSISTAVIILAIGMTLFGWLVNYHSKTEQNKLFCRYFEIINDRELHCINGRFHEYPDGSEYINRDHENSYDLDLFGHSSVFQFINRTTSKPAADILAKWLKEPASIEEINLRQQAFLELKDQIDWRQKLNSLAYSNSHGSNDPAILVRWVQEEIPGNQKYLKAIIYSLSALALGSTILVALFRLPFSLLMIAYSINFIYYFSQAKKISKVHFQVSKSSEMLKSYASTIRLIEDNRFNCIKLKELHNIFTRNTKVSEEIGLLSKLVNRLDARLNIMVAIPLNLYFFWDIQQCIALENWKKRHGNEISDWFSGMAEFEVLSCFANMAFNNPEWTTPVIVPEYFKLEAKSAGHPLIPIVRRVANSFSVSGSGKTVIV